MENDTISTVDLINGLLDGTATAETKTLQAGILFRADVLIIARVGALASVSGKSRNYMLNQLVRIGLEELEKTINPDTAEKVSIQESLQLASLMGEQSETLTQGSD